MRREGKRPTIHEVARLAGVSIGTVSNVLNGKGKVREVKRTAVEQAVAALGYCPNPIARSLITRRVRGSLPRRVRGPRLTTVGYLSVDYTARLNALPERDGRITALGIEKSLGGPAANVAVMAAGLGGRWAVDCELITALGSDADSEWALAELAMRHVDVIGIRRGNRRLSRCIVLVESDGNRSIVNEPLTLEEESVVSYLGRNPEDGHPHCVHFDGYQVARMSPSMRQIRELGFKTSTHTTGLDPNWRNIDTLCKLRSDFDLVFLNRDVARDILAFRGNDTELLWKVTRLCRTTSPKDALGFVLLTLGPAGAVLFRGRESPIHSPAPRLPAIDTTGAGDAFAGIFLATWLNGEPLASALRFAVVGASHSITEQGALGLRITGHDLRSWHPTEPSRKKRAPSPSLFSATMRAKRRVRAAE